jgi:hypothetical protein
MENLMEVRNKYISKVQNKITKLSKSLNLLTQLDKTLINNIKKLPQSGGNFELANLGVEIAHTKAKYSKFKSDTELKWEGELDKLAQSTAGITMDMEHLKKGINGYTELLNKLTFADIKLPERQQSMSDGSPELHKADFMLHLSNSGVQKIENIILNILNDNGNKSDIINNIILEPDDYAEGTPADKYNNIKKAVKEHLNKKFLEDTDGRQNSRTSTTTGLPYPPSLDSRPPPLPPPLSPPSLDSRPPPLSPPSLDSRPPPLSPPSFFPGPSTSTAPSYRFPPTY